MVSLASVRVKNAAVNLAGKRAVVVGGTSGIGQGIALRLAQANASVTLVGRNRQAADEILGRMQALSKSPDAKFDFVQCDGSLLSNVKQFAAAYSSRVDRLDYLVLTQGIATLRGFTPTAEGLDQKLALHFYSRMAFIDQLLPLLRRSSDARVLSVLSGGMHSAYKQYVEDPDLEKDYSLMKAANAAGFYNDIALDSFSRENPELTCIHANPGMVSTKWGSDFPWYLKPLVRFGVTFGRALEDCGEFMCDPLFDAGRKGGFHVAGQYGQPAEKTPEHETAREAVWRHTQQVLRSKLD